MRQITVIVTVFLWFFALPTYAISGLGSAHPDTIYFGGTVWAPDSSRWEAIQDSCWTFDSGVGSHFDHSGPNVNPFKDPTLHAYMEGWIGVDRSYGGVNPYFRRVHESEFGGDVCVGSAAGLSGAASLWAGAFASEAATLCYVSGQGYGNNWFVSLEKSLGPYVGGSITLSYDYATHTEPGFDYTYCSVDTSGSGDFVNIDTYTGMQDGTAVGTLTQGQSLPFTTGGTIKLVFTVGSDGAYSDQDGLFPTDCGAMAVDNVSLTGAITDFSDFEVGTNGWMQPPPSAGAGGDWSRLAHLSDLGPSAAPGTCDLQDSVLAFFDTGNSHPWFQDNLALSPWIDLKAAGAVGKPGKFIQASVYANLPQDGVRGIRSMVAVQWYPWACPETGTKTVSPVIDMETFFGHDPVCSQAGSGGFKTDISHLVDPAAEQIRIGVGMWDRCGRFLTPCPDLLNSSPWFDNIALGVYGSALGVPGDDSSISGLMVRPFAPNPMGVLGGATYFDLEQPALVAGRIFDIRGQLVRSLFSDRFEQGTHSEFWNGSTDQGRRAPAGVYFLVLQTESGHRETRKVIVIGGSSN